MNKLTLFISIIGIFVSCKNAVKEESTESNDTVSIVQTIPDGVIAIDTSTRKIPQQIEPLKEEKREVRKQDSVLPIKKTGDDRYSLVVSFFSKGEGKDNETLNKFSGLLNSYKTKLIVENYTWGREGEIDYCIRTDKMRPAEQKEFIRKAKEILELSELVHMQENAACKHKR